MYFWVVCRTRRVACERERVERVNNDILNIALLVRNPWTIDNWERGEISLPAVGIVEM